MKTFKTLLFLFLAVITILSFKKAEKVNIWMIGDSTMASKKPERAPESGWGVAMSEFVRSNALVHNHAASGRSTKSFIDEKRWKAVSDSIQPGDYVIIEFGHNDEKPDSTLHTDPYTTYQQNLKRFVQETRFKGGIPIICSSIVRRHFDGKGNLLNSHGEYINAARQIAEQTQVSYVDMEALTRHVVSAMGPEGSKSLYTFCNPGEYKGRKNGVQDSTHLNFDGSRKVAGLFVNEAKRMKLSLAEYLK
jgi:Lysophospholipase L1 and related esterases